MPWCTPIKGARPNSALVPPSVYFGLVIFHSTMVKRVMINKEGYHLVCTRDLPKAEAISQASGFGS